jgi:hypothetical protein
MWSCASVLNSGASLWPLGGVVGDAGWSRRGYVMRLLRLKCIRRIQRHDPVRSSAGLKVLQSEAVVAVQLRSPSNDGALC